MPLSTRQHVRCQARLRIDPGDDIGRCPAPAKGAYMLDVDRGVRLLCGLHSNMGARVDAGPMDVESSALPTDLVASLRDAHTRLLGLLQHRIGILVTAFNASSAMVDKCGAVLHTREHAKDEDHA